MKDGRELVEKAVGEAKALKEAALSAAKNSLIEEMTPSLRAIVENTLQAQIDGKKERAERPKRGVRNNVPSGTPGGLAEGTKRGDPTMDATDNKDKELDMESLTSFFPAISEAPPEPGAEEGIPTLGEEEEPVTEKKEDEDEEIEISEAELKKVYEAALQTEVTVKKNFSEMTPTGELDEVKPGDGIADVKTGETTWDAKGALPPEKKDFTMKEAKELIKRGYTENKQLRAKLIESVKLVRKLHEQLSQVNLFNAKVMSVNKLLQRHTGLTVEAKKSMMESVDQARSIEEVRMVEKTITNSFKVARGSLAEGTRRPAANAQRPRTSGAPGQKVLRESVDNKKGAGISRFKQLAGIVK